jgi:hypothetical protein
MHLLSCFKQILLKGAVALNFLDFFVRFLPPQASLKHEISRMRETIFINFK